MKKIKNNKLILSSDIFSEEYDPSRDLYNHLEKLEPEIRTKIDAIADLNFHEVENLGKDEYEACRDTIRRLNKLGFAADFYLDGVVFDLVKIPEDYKAD